jgi:hypothetical protein
MSLLRLLVSSVILVLAACSADADAVPKDEQCREACRSLAPAGCEVQCAQKCRGPCLEAPSDLKFEFSATTRIACAPEGGPVSFEVERDAYPTVLACK